MPRFSTTIGHHRKNIKNLNINHSVKCFNVSNAVDISAKLIEKNVGLIHGAFYHVNLQKCKIKKQYEFVNISLKFGFQQSLCDEAIGRC